MKCEECMSRKARTTTWDGGVPLQVCLDCAYGIVSKRWYGERCPADQEEGTG